MRDPDQEYLNREGDYGPVVNHEFRDLSLKGEVSEALGFLEDLDASQVEIDARSGVVTLFGTVSSQREKDEAFDRASDVEGVVTVINLLDVK